MLFLFTNLTLFRRVFHRQTGQSFLPCLLLQHCRANISKFGKSRLTSSGWKKWQHWMFKTIYLVNNPYIERLKSHLLISIQTLIFQPHFAMRALILRFGDLWLSIRSVVYELGEFAIVKGSRGPQTWMDLQTLRLLAFTLIFTLVPWAFLSGYSYKLVLCSDIALHTAAARAVLPNSLAANKNENKATVALASSNSLRIPDLIWRGIGYFVQNNTIISLPGDTHRVTIELPCRTPATHSWRQIRS